MIGFEVNINNQESIIAASDNFVFVHLKHGYPSDRIVVMGSDILHYFTWFDGKPEIGDKVLIKIVETDRLSSVQTMKDCDRNAMKKKYE